MSLSFVPAYTVPGVYKSAADASKNIKVRIKFVNGKVVVETLSNANNPKGCDQARSLVEESLDLKDSVESAVSKHPIEEKLTTPSPAQIEEVQQIQQTNDKL